MTSYRSVVFNNARTWYQQAHRSVLMPYYQECLSEDGSSSIGQVYDVAATRCLRCCFCSCWHGCCINESGKRPQQRNIIIGGVLPASPMLMNHSFIKTNKQLQEKWGAVLVSFSHICRLRLWILPL